MFVVNLYEAFICFSNEHTLKANVKVVAVRNKIPRHQGTSKSEGVPHSCCWYQCGQFHVLYVLTPVPTL